MDVAQLESFIEVVRHQSFTRAAEALGLTQPGVTRQIQRLEAELGTPLLRRARGEVTPTAEGAEFAAFAQSVIDGYRSFRRAPPSPQAIQGALRIAASTTPGEFLVPRLVSGFLERYPAVRPHVVILDSAAVVEQLHAGDHDAGFTGARFPMRGLRYAVIADDEVVLAVPGSHPFAKRKRVPLDALERQAFIEREGGSGTLQSVHQVLKQHGLKHPEHRVVMVLSNTEAVVSAVEQGFGLGWVSSRALEHRDPGRVRPVRLEELVLRRPLYLVYRAGPLSPPAAAFVTWARSQAMG